MSYFISLIGACRSICMCALSLSDAVCKMDTKKEDLESGSRGRLHYQIVGWVESRGSQICYTASGRFVLLLHFPSSLPVFLFPSISLCPRPLPLLVFRRRTSFRNEQHGFLSFSIPWTCDKSFSRESRRVYESGEECFGNQFCWAIHRREKAMPGYR